MNWELKLIKDDMMVESMMQCAYVKGFIRLSRQEFTHEEMITVYIHGIKMGFRNIKNIHRYCYKHLPEWFPKRPCYSFSENYFEKTHAQPSLTKRFAGLLFFFYLFQDSLLSFLAQPPK